MDMAAPTITESDIEREAAFDTVSNDWRDVSLLFGARGLSATLACQLRKKRSTPDWERILAAQVVLVVGSR